MSDLICLSMLDAAHLPSGLVPSPIRSVAEDFSPSRRASFLAGRSLLAAWCQLHHGCSELPEMVMGPHGRPAFSDPSLPEFSISHSGDWLWLAIGETSLGLDVEQHRPRRNLGKLMDHVLSPLELAWVSSQDDELRAFYRLWTLREAVLKASGRGLAGLSQLQLFPDEHRIQTNEVGAGQVLVTESGECSVALYLSLPTESNRALVSWCWKPVLGFIPTELTWQVPWQLTAPHGL